MGEAERFPDLDLAPLDSAELSERDAALAHAIYEGAIRHWTTLEFLIGTALQQPFGGLEPAVRAILLSGAAQLLLLDRVPAHAVLHDSVEIAKRRVRPGAGSLVNAVLRRVVALAGTTEPRPEEWASRRDLIPLGDGRVRRLTSAILPADDRARLSVVTGNPRWLLDQWTTLHAVSLDGLALHSLAFPPTILNTAHASSPVPDSLATHERAGHHVFTGGRAALTHLVHDRPDIWVQDAASSLAVASAAGLGPRLIVDFCAGQGTKTRQLAATFPTARIIATDADGSRLRTLAAQGLDRERVRITTLDEAVADAAGRADLVLLDVPCSNTGVLARRIEAKYRCGPAQLERLTAIQREIIDRGVTLLAPGGRLLYSTCSIDPAENERQVQWCAARHGLAVERSILTLPSGLPGWPASSYHDGSFSALMARS